MKEESSTGFITQSQKSGGTSFIKPGLNQEDRKIAELINKAITEYDVSIKKYIATFTKDYMGNSGFADRKISDTPTDALSLVNRKFVTLNGSTANRPGSPVTGQMYFDTSLGYPVWYNGSNFVDSQGNVV